MTTCHTSKLTAYLLLLLVLTSQAFAEAFHVSEFVPADKGFNRIIILNVYQTDSGLVTVYAMDSLSGPTQFNQWYDETLDLPFPALAITQIIRSNGGQGIQDNWVKLYQREELIKIDSTWINQPLGGDILHDYDSAVSGSWANSLFVGWIYTQYYPWVYSFDLGWTWALESQVYDHALTFWLCSENYGWIWTSANFDHYCWVASTGDWLALGS